jgi:hypothetical protein
LAKRFGNRPRTEDGIKPQKVTAGLRCLKIDPVMEADRSVIRRENVACHFAAFFGHFPSMEAEIDDKMPSNSR